ncbi:MAG: choice-of-anchor B family protein [Bacteroidetes bacterium]|nr:choice-of-anchor B family protein [Bacteroidota bacterium]MDA0873738.1 choice-of-anchor B family protein [Bacteroidota bacterium]
MRSVLFLILLAFLSTPLHAQQFGSTAVAASDRFLVSDATQPTQPGAVHVYGRTTNGTWSQVSRFDAGTRAENGDGFGRTMATDGQLVAIATSRQRVDIHTMQEDGNLMYVNSLQGDQEGFGTHVAVAGNRVFVTTSSPLSPARVQVWHPDTSGAWVLESELAAPDGGADDGFGSVISAGGTHVLVGAPTTNEGSGAVYAFYLDEASGMWSLGQRLNVTFPIEGSGFGSTLWMKDDLAAVAAPGFGRGAGIVALYRLRDGAWAPDGRLSPFASDRGMQFGTSIAESAGQLLVGAPGAGGGAGSGAVFAFALGGEDDPMAATRTGLVPVPAALHRGSQFGGAVVALDDALLVGAPGHDNRAGVVFIADPSSPEWAGPFINETFGYASMGGELRPCEDGKAGDFPCDGVDIMSFVSMDDLGADRGIRTNDLWGWEDPDTGREYAIVGLTNATSFVDVTDPFQPRVLGILRMTETANMAVWRDMKVYKNHAYIVSDGAGKHGMQIFDLTRLRDVPDAPVEFEADGLYENIFSAHNIVINEETGFGYSVGSSAGGTTCGGGLHMIDLRDPKNPTFAGCFSDGQTGRRGTGYSHDAQCVVYHGPDLDYTGREICIGSNETAISIADVTDKENPISISIATYPAVAYAHQGWFTEDQRYFYLNDEIDEANGTVDGTRTLIWDLADLDDPILAGEHVAKTTETDHNLYVKGNLMYQSNTAAGLRILDITDPENPFETAYFDTSPVGGRGVSWSNYPYYRSGMIAVTAGHYGLFLLKKREVDL